MTVAKKILLTGATGFVGSVLLNKIEASNLVIFGRNSPDNYDGIFHKYEMDSNSDFATALDGIEVIVHCAARAHIMNDNALDPLAEFRKVNVEGTLNLARQAAAAGVVRFIYISSIKVSGESTSGLRSFVEGDRNPSDPYGVSKMEAENALQKLALVTGMEVVIIRPPLIYGPGVKANFFNLLKLSNSKFPLPFACVNNKRSMVYVENLVDFIIRCIDHPKAANQTFLVSDGEDLSLKSLITYIRKSMGRSACLLPVPVGLFKLVGKLTGKIGVVDRLVCDLQVDSSKARKLLDWTPPYSVEQGIAATVLDFRNVK
ncbi:SDR family oxidoreductase [Oceaniserpentilla sp. 4NH20-0058]|uniref:UDP-glucose 4-epimerase family protein n=1 Tax=Oceaniserpentilla sp. 4NH20-0058 TaxID=3127660 RepID=UPI003107A270